MQLDMISLARLPETKMTMRAALLREKNSKEVNPDGSQVIHGNGCREDQRFQD